jgi:4-amino-4-deoxy-L-arabinose transferase-like glycosyltransferase
MRHPATREASSQIWTLPADSSHFHFAVLLLVCLLLYFPLLGARDFWDFENRWAEVTRVMLLDGNYAIPKVNGEVWADKPPLYFWLTLVFSWLAGQVNEWTMRLPSALSATASVLIFYLFAKKKFGGSIAFLSALVLETSLLTIDLARHIRADMLFSLWFTLSMFLLMEVIVFDSTRSRVIYGAWVCMALACMTKGPLGILLPGLVVSLYLLLSRSWSKIFALRPLAGSLLFLALTVPWYVFVIWKTEGLWLRIFFYGGKRRPLYRRSES